MEVTTGPRNVPENVIMSGLVLLLTTLLAGGVITLLIRYIVGRRSRSRQEQDSSKKHIRAESFLASLPYKQKIPPMPSKPEDYANVPLLNRRAKNKKRREAQQERTHPWIVGNLKGHTSAVCDVDFSSNGRYLASCAEDESLPPRVFAQWVRDILPCVIASLPTYDDMCPRTTPPSLGIDSSQCPSRNRSRTSTTVNNFTHIFGNGGRGDGELFRSRSRRNLLISSPDDEKANNFMPIVQSGSDWIKVRERLLGSRSQRDLPISSPDDEEAVKQAVVTDQTKEDYKRLKMTFINDSPLVYAIKKYKLTLQEMIDHGYPIEIYDPPCCAMIYSTVYPTGQSVACSSNMGTATNTTNTGHDSGHCTGSSPDNSDQEQSDNEKNVNSEKNSEGDKSSESGKRSDSENSSDNEKSSDSEKGSDNDKNLDNEKESDSEKRSDGEKGNELEVLLMKERKCVRCQKIFRVDKNAEYLCAERCIYHWGKMHNGLINGMMNGNYWTCCQKPETSRGCAEAKVHVWTGLVPGINGPFAGYVRTPPVISSGNDDCGVYSLDCEMCYTRYGLELTKVTLVDVNGKIVYDTLVKPTSEIIDYNTRFSGITEKDMLNVTKTLHEVQKDLFNFVSAETILIGHGMANDFRALRLLHDNVVDTTVMFPHFLGFPYCNALKTLARRVLKREIQENVHDSIEDARVVMDLVLRKVRHDWNDLPLPHKLRILTRE